MSDSIELSHGDVSLMMHATGNMRRGANRQASRVGDCYRNYFAATPDSHNDGRWRVLVGHGLASLASGPNSLGNYNTYCVTEKGWGHLLAHRVPKPSKDGGGAEYYIMDARSRVGNCVLWWGVDGNGYTCDLNRAGLYTLAEALRGDRETDIPIHRDDAQALVIAHVRLDNEHGRALLKHGRKLIRRHRARRSA